MLILLLIGFVCGDQNVYKRNVCVCVCVCVMMHIKEPLLLIKKRSPVAVTGYLSHYLSGPLQYV